MVQLSKIKPYLSLGWQFRCASLPPVRATLDQKGSKLNKTSLRFITVIILALSISIAFAQDEMVEPADSPEERKPTTLAEAHAELERILPPEELAKIDAMKSDDDMIKYHSGLGMDIRNGWGLWSGSALKKHMQQLGFTHPDDMSGVILETFWCKRHGKPFLLKERAAEYASSWDAAKKAEEKEQKRVESAKLKMRSMMMGLRLVTGTVPIIKMPNRIDRSLRARFLSRYGDGVFITVRNKTGPGDDAYVLEPYFFSPEDGMIHEIHIPEIKHFSSALVAGQAAWFTGTSEGASFLIKITPTRRLMIDLPKDGQPPQLGLHHDDILAVYPKAFYKLVDNHWQAMYEGDISLPKSGPPPQLYGDVLYFRDEGKYENNKRLWWLKMGHVRGLKSLDQDIGVVGSHGPRWENSFSYTVTNTGDLWACVGEGHARKSLLRKSKTGVYAIAIMNNSVGFTPKLFGSEETDQGISVSAVASSPDDTILLVGDGGLYRLKETELFQELAFTNTQQNILINDGKNVSQWRWAPSNVLALEENAYFMSGAFGGIYTLKKDKNGEWAIQSLDEKLGDPITW